MKTLFNLLFIFSSICSYAQVDTVFYLGFENVGPITTYSGGPPPFPRLQYINGLDSNITHKLINSQADLASPFVASGSKSYQATNPTATDPSAIFLDVRKLNLKQFEHYNKLEMSLNYFDPGGTEVIIGVRSPGLSETAAEIGHYSSNSSFRPFKFDLDSVFSTHQMTYIDTNSFQVYFNLDDTSMFVIDDLLITASIEQQSNYITDILTDTISCKYGQAERFKLKAINYNMLPFSDSIKLITHVYNSQGALIQSDSNINFFNLVKFEEYTLHSEPLDLSLPGQYEIEFILKAANDTLADDDTLRQLIYNTAITPGFVENFDQYQFSSSTAILPPMSPLWSPFGTPGQQRRQSVAKGSIHVNFGPSQDANPASSADQYAYIGLNNVTIPSVEHQLSCFSQFIDSNRLLALNYFYHGYEVDGHSLNHHVIHAIKGQEKEILFMHGDSVAAQFQTKNANWQQATTFVNTVPNSHLIFRASKNVINRNDHWFMDQLTFNFSDTNNLRVRHRFPIDEREICPDTIAYQFDLVNTSSDTIDLSLNNLNIKSYVYRASSIVDSFTTIVNSAQHGQYLLPYSDLTFSYNVDLSVQGNYTFTSFLLGNQDAFVSDDTTSQSFSSVVVPGSAFAIPPICPSDSLGVVVVGSNKNVSWQIFDSTAMQWTDIPNTNNVHFYQFISQNSHALRAKVCDSYFTNVAQVNPLIIDLFNPNHLNLAINDSLTIMGDSSYSNFSWQVDNGAHLFGPNITINGLNYNLGQTITVVQSAVDANNCLITDTLSITMTLPTALTEFGTHGSQILIHPNPAKQKCFIIQTENSDAKVWIRDARGNLKRQFTITGRKRVLNLKGLSSGLYLISIQTEKATFSKKLMVIE